MLSTNMDLAQKLDELERKQSEHGNQLRTVYEVVKQLIDPPPREEKRERGMGFETERAA